MSTITSKDVKEERRTIAGREIPVAVVPHLREIKYQARVTTGIWSLLTGMRLTLQYFTKPALTQQYPDNRKTLRFPERYRAVLKLKFLARKEPVRRWQLKAGVNRPHGVKPHILQRWMRGCEEVRYHKCTGCGSCETACPNGSIRVLTRMGEVTEDRELDRFVWRMDSCMFCNACVQACPHDALEMGPEFENAVYDRRLLIYNLNPLAGPAARFVMDESEEQRQKMIATRDLCGGPIPLNGHFLPNVRPLAVTPLLDAPPSGLEPTTEAGQ